MKLLMSVQEAGTCKDHQKALSYLVLRQGLGHRTVPCRSAVIREGVGKTKHPKSLCPANIHAPCSPSEMCLGFWDLCLLATLFKELQRCSSWPVMALDEADY